MIISLRPDIGISALSLGQVIGAKAEENLLAKHPIKLKEIRFKRISYFKNKLFSKLKRVKILLNK